MGAQEDQEPSPDQPNATLVPAPEPTPTPTPSPTPLPDDDGSSGGSTAGIIVGIVIAAAIIAFASWYIWAHLRARRLGLPPPKLNPFRDRTHGTAASGGVVNWMKEKIGMGRDRRRGGDAYEARGGGGFNDSGTFGRRAGGRRPFGGLEPDEAWDSRVGAEADAFDGYEEQELSQRTAPAKHADGR